MTPSDIERIEKETEFKFPQCYIDVVTNYPAELLKSDAPDFGLLDDPDEIIMENNDVRSSGYFGQKWPDRYLIIGKNGCGDYYVVSHDSKEFSVGFADHEAMDCMLYANNLNEFIEKYLSEQE
jgi:hypothetical protein